MLGNYFKFFKLIFFSTMPSLISFVKSEVWPSWACYDLHHHCPDPLLPPHVPHFHSYFYFLYKNLSFHSLSSQVYHWRLLQRLLERVSGPTFFQGERVVLANCKKALINGTVMLPSAALSNSKYIVWRQYRKGKG